MKVSSNSLLSSFKPIQLHPTPSNFALTRAAYCCSLLLTAASRYTMLLHTNSVQHYTNVVQFHATLC
ncbi:hypothetical protein CANARDRAFT_28016 [[Candida] arabinofermentans NRRL YB-2248]|uniref:Uncharacterized protein n=1 Tax=[Candida] arabinofermentans NRRL YB-2248 TaxID=983967 RepID=A0A1E4T2H9_9ASCO|nr:hypothetical protein CANARDRAFT_28016 [[Candida] arabinofermentans NRRL YB-2248]